MNKAQLINEMSAISGLSRAKTKMALDAMISIAMETLSKGESIRIKNVGSFSVAKRSARTGRNPQTGLSINIPARKVVKYKANCPGPHFI